MARTRTKRLGSMDRAQMMSTAEAVSAKRYPMESNRISDGRATLLGLFNLDTPTWVIEVHGTTEPHYLCLTQRKLDVFCHTIVGHGELDWKLWMGDEAPSTTNSGDYPDTFRNYHSLAVNLHEQPTNTRSHDQDPGR